MSKSKYKSILTVEEVMYKYYPAILEHIQKYHEEELYGYKSRREEK
jgi:hypothetical protein